MTAINLVVAAGMLVCGLWLPVARLPWLVSSAIVALALTAPLALARRQGTRRDEIPPTACQWALFVAIWVATALWFVTLTWALAPTWSPSVSLESPQWVEAPPGNEAWLQALESLSSLARTVALVVWLVLVIHLTTRIGGRGPGRARASAPMRLRSRWPGFIFVVMIPANLALIVWVIGGGGLVSGLNGWDGLGLAVTVTPILFVLLSLTTVQVLRTAWSAHGALLTPNQAWLQLALWVGLAAVGAGVTLTSSEGEEYSVVLSLLPGAIGLSKAVAWLGLTGAILAYALLLISLRARRLSAPRARQDLIIQTTPA